MLAEMCGWLNYSLEGVLDGCQAEPCLGVCVGMSQGAKEETSGDVDMKW